MSYMVLEEFSTDKVRRGISSYNRSLAALVFMVEYEKHEFGLFFLETGAKLELLRPDAYVGRTKYQIGISFKDKEGEMMFRLKYQPKEVNRILLDGSVRKVQNGINLSVREIYNSNSIKY